MLSDGSTGRIRKLSNGKLPNTVSSFSSVEEGKIKSENQRNGRKKDREKRKEAAERRIEVLEMRETSERSSSLLPL